MIQIEYGGPNTWQKLWTLTWENIFRKRTELCKGALFIFFRVLLRENFDTTFMY